MITEAIILAGGLGTRLRSVLNDVPKCLAPVRGIPFIDYVIRYAIQQGIRKCILSVGYKTASIEAFIHSKNYGIPIIFCEEKEPLGTGGAIKKALQMANTKSVLVLNGDTYFAYDLEQIVVAHEKANAACTICLKPMENFSRYGTVLCDANNMITAFKEKKFTEKGLINTGVYTMDTDRFLAIDFPEKFSFETEYLSKESSKQILLGCIQDNYFIDIGIPEDYARAQKELKTDYEN